MRLELERPLGAGAQARFELMALLGEAHPRQAVRVRLNGVELAHWTFSGAEAGGWRILELPSARVAGRERLTFEFDIADPRSPAALGMSPDDQRALGIGLVQFIVADDASGH